MVLSEKVTFSLPVELKQELIEIKKETNVSLNSLYQTAIAQYLERKEIERWQIGADKASKNKEYLTLCDELGNKGVEFEEY